MIDLDAALNKLGLTKAPCDVRFLATHLRVFELGAFLDSGDEQWIEINPKNRLACLGYSQQRVLEHELIHACRAHFEDSFWEELLAYQTSKYSYQKFLGPLLSSKSSQYLLFALPVSTTPAPFFAYGAVFVMGGLCLLVLRQIYHYRLLKRVYAFLKKRDLVKTKHSNT